MRWALALLATVLVAAAGVALLAKRDHSVPLVTRTDGLGAKAGKLKAKVKRQTEPLPRPACTAGVPKCASVSGRVVYVERVDPDGDGDLHVVVTDGSVTTPGLTAVDVRVGLRPSRDPRIGDRAAAMGPVQTGSHKQQQIHALTFTVIPR